MESNVSSYIFLILIKFVGGGGGVVVVVVG